MSFKFIDHSPEVLAAFKAAAERALERCGSQGEGYAQDLCPVDTGALRNSISHKVDKGEPAAYIGTNQEYGSYVELGTGKYYKGGSYGWWVYVDGASRKKGKKGHKTYTYEEAKRVVAILRSKGLDAHMTEGQEAQPYLKPAVADHKQTYKNIIESEMKGSSVSL